MLHCVKLEAIGWEKSYRVLKKKAMEQELSWSRFIISLSIAFFIVAGSALALRLVYQSINNNFNEAKRIEGQRLIQSGLLAGLFFNKAQAADLDLQATPIKDTEYTNLNSGQVSSQTIKLKNTGKDLWLAKEVNLETGPFLKSFSKVEASSWLKFYRPVQLPKDVKPGQTVEITFPLKAPLNLSGTIQENFQLVRQERPIKGSLVRVFITINQVGTSKPTPLTTPQVKSNTIVATPAPIINAPTTNLCLTASGEQINQYQNCNTNPKEENNIDGIIPNIILTSEPIIRVGLFNSNLAQRITFDSLFDVYGGQDVIFSGLTAGSIVLASFDQANQRYSVNVNEISKTTKMPLRFIPRERQGVATLLDYKNNPAWNLSLLDNRFRGIIEMRYTMPAKKIWLINELPIETYLRGLAETTNASPVEFQKVMATAARSYALYHYLRGIEYGLIDASTKHADDHFHIDAYYDQVYRGYNSEIRMPKMAQAIELTRGVAVSYNNKPVVTPYFSNSDGRTRDWTEVWGGVAKPWLKSVLVPEDNGKTLFGHGVGLSARGALLMINNNKSWSEVLKYFYTGINLIKIY